MTSFREIAGNKGKIKLAFGKYQQLTYICIGK
jgi:hypothetical protein